MTRRRSAIAALLVLPFVGAAFVAQNRTTTDSARLLDQVLTLVSQRFVDTVSTATLYEKAAKGLVKELNDPYSELFSPKELESFSRNTNGRYAGIGMLIEDQQGAITISKVYPHTPAEAAGIREGDRILFVDSVSTRGWKTQQVSDSLIGRAGTKVTVTFGRPGVTEPIKTTFTRREIHIPAVPYAIVLENRIGYLNLQRFNETSAEEVRTAIESLEKQGVRGVVLDMRGNPGGILDQSITMSNLFLPENKEIVSVRSRTGAPQVYGTRGKAAFPSLPLTVLTDGYSASASEIVAGALQDHDRALIVGTTSFGKGLVQTLFPLDGGYALKITTAKWYTPSGRSIQRERKFVDGKYVEVRPDSLETEAERKARPVFRSDAGRIVYGGGGVTPDVLVREDTLTTPEQTLAKALAPKSQDVYVTLSEYALELSHSATQATRALPAWRDEMYRRLVAKGVTMDRAQYDAGARYIDRLLEKKVITLAFGDSTAKRRDLPDDAPLRRALDLMSRSTTQRELIAAAQAAVAVSPTSRRPDQ